MLLMEGVHSYQRSTSLRISQTASVDASIETSLSTVILAMKFPLWNIWMLWMLSGCNSKRLFLERLACCRAVLAGVDQAAVSLCNRRCSEKTGGYLLVLRKIGRSILAKSKKYFAGMLNVF